MFFGTTPSVISQFLHKEIKGLNPKRAFVPFAGNFVVEQLCRLAFDNLEIFSTDVSLYSRGIGFGVTDQKFKCNLIPEIAEQFDKIASLSTPMEKAAQIIFLTDAARNLGKAHIPYYAELGKDAVSNQEKYIDKILLKLESFRDKTKGMNFLGEDACKLIPDVSEGDLCFYDPPVLLGDYEKMFKPLEDCYEFDEVEYTQMTDEIKEGHLIDMHQKGAVVYYRTNNPIEPLPGYQEVFRFNYKYNGNYCVYTNKANRLWVGQFEPLKEEIRNYPMMGPEDTIKEDSEVNILRVPVPVANHYRMMWVKKAQMSSAGYAYLVFVDKKLLGVLVLDSALKFGTDLVALYSDPVVPSTHSFSPTQNRYFSYLASGKT